MVTLGDFTYGTMYCGPTCTCPAWSTGCVHLLPITQVPPDPMTEARLAKIRPPEICSFNIDDKDSCSRQLVKQTFMQISLPSGAIHVVNSLHVSVPDYDPEAPAVCFNGTSRQLELITKKSAPPVITGTSRFCSHYNCSTTATTFCFFPTSPAKLHANNMTMPISAWGAAPYQYYPFLAIKVPAPLRFEATCSMSTITIYVHGPNRTDYHLDICYDNLCSTTRSTVPSFTVQLPELPPETNLILKLWDTGSIVSSRNVTCEDVCSTDCIWCWSHFRYPQCLSIIDWIVFFALLFMVSFAINILSHTCNLLNYTSNVLHYIGRILMMLLRIIWIPLRSLMKPVRLLLFPLKYICRYLVMPCKALYTMRHYISPKRRKWIPPTSISLLLLSIVSQATACNQVTSFDGTATTCTRVDNFINCSTAGATILTLGAHKTESCLLLTNDAQEPLGFLSLRVENLEIHCNKDTLYFTRDHELNVQSTHRCSGSDSCDDNSYCGKIKPTDIIDEFTGAARTSPGFTSCYSDCGGPFCGCVWFTQSCVFSRLYATSTSNTIYEVFQCPSWNTHVTLNASLQYHDVDIAHTITLLPGETYHFPDQPITVDVLTSSLPQLPILAHSFISDGQRIAFTNVNPPNHFIGGVIGQLQCPSSIAAANFSCQFRPQSCACSNADHSVLCTCPTGYVAEQLQEYLPLQQHNVDFLPDKDTISARVPLSQLQIQVSMAGLKIATIKSDTACIVTPLTLEGCFSCGEGALLQYKCSTSTKEKTTALISCGTSIGTIECDDDQKEKTTRINFFNPELEYNCTAFCGRGTNFTLKRYLNEKNHETHEFQKIRVEGIIPNQWDWEMPWTSALRFINSGFNSLLTPFIYGFVIIIALITAIKFRMYIQEKPKYN